MRRSESSDTEAGFTVMEIIVASAMLIAACAVFFTGLASLQRTSAFEAHRTRALDDLRITAGTFAKDARHASEIISASADEMVMRTYVNGSMDEVRYRVVASGGQRDLLRTGAGGDRLFVIKLTSASIFEYDNPVCTGTTICTGTDAAAIRRVRLHMESKPQQNHPAAVLATEVALRNVQT